MDINNLLDFEVHLTTACNMQCEFCGADVLRDGRRYEIDFDSIKSLIDDAKREGITRITFSGGEPFLVNNFRKIIEYALQLNFLVNVSTNGLLIDAEYAKYAANRKINTRISIHSLDSKKYSKITKSNTLERVIESVHILKDNKAYYSLTATIYDENVDEIEELVKFAYQNGASSIRFTPVYPTNLGEKHYATEAVITKLLLSCAKSVIRYYDDVDSGPWENKSSPMIADIMTTRHCLAKESRFVVFTAEKSSKPCPFYPKQVRDEKDEMCRCCIYDPICQGGCEGLNPINKESPFLCVRHILKSVTQSFTEDEQQKLFNYWNHIYWRYSYNKHTDIGCIRKLPIWEIVFNEEFLRRVRYAQW